MREQCLQFGQHRAAMAALCEQREPVRCPGPVSISAGPWHVGQAGAGHSHDANHGRLQVYRVLWWSRDSNTATKTHTLAYFFVL